MQLEYLKRRERLLRWRPLLSGSILVAASVCVRERQLASLVACPRALALLSQPLQYCE